MGIIRFDSADAYLASAGPLVEHDPARTAGLQAWVEGAKHADAAERRFMAIWRSGEYTGAAHQRGEHPVVVGDSAGVACIAFAEALADEHPQLAGVIGSRASCEAFAQRWQFRTGMAHRLQHELRHHVLDALLPSPDTDGSIRVAIADDREWLMAMQAAFTTETGLPALSPQSARRTVDGWIVQQRIRIWRAHEDVAFAGLSIAGPAAARVGPVYTRPAFRGRGYARALVGALCEELRAQQRRVFLVTDVSNATSNALYARLGFVPLSDECSFGFA